MSATLGSAPRTDRFDVRVTADSHLAWLRTRMALERTLMSWVRTAAALIGFGFTIFQFGERLLPAPEGGGYGPRVVALALVAAGTIASFVALDQYRRMIRYMWS